MAGGCQLISRLLGSGVAQCNPLALVCSQSWRKRAEEKRRNWFSERGHAENWTQMCSWDSVWKKHSTCGETNVCSLQRRRHAIWTWASPSNVNQLHSCLSPFSPPPPPPPCPQHNSALRLTSKWSCKGILIGHGRAVALRLMLELNLSHACFCAETNTRTSLRLSYPAWSHLKLWV